MRLSFRVSQTFFSNYRVPAEQRKRSSTSTPICRPCIKVSYSGSFACGHLFAVASANLRTRDEERAGQSEEGRQSSVRVCVCEG